MPEQLTAVRRRQLLGAMRHPRGRYPAARAAQLSGVPETTLYDWQRSSTYVPDFARAGPMAWSYRDLVYVRLLAWLRHLRMPRPVAAARVDAVRAHVTAGHGVRLVRATARSIVFDEETSDRVSGTSLLPFDDLAALGSVFDLLHPAEELGDRPLRGPDLVAPSAHTTISPWVLGGEPCVAGTRIPTVAIHALREERGLTAAQVAVMYPGLTVAAVEDAHELERRLRGRDPERATR
jgi:uncharacterized protein (DUF433 family)